METRLKSESLEPLIDFLGYLVQKVRVKLPSSCFLAITFEPEMLVGLLYLFK